MASSAQTENPFPPNSKSRVRDDPDDSQQIRHLLQDLIDPARILTRPIDRIAFASDASFYRLIPRAVIQPLNAEEVKHLFRFSHNRSLPLVFRAGGTSLSGQSITDGILVDVGRHFRSVRVEESGASIRVQPGVLGQHANDALRLYGRKIGPDPASISSCRMGGILANNASGMCCGVVQNAYHTLRSLTFVLPSGTQIDSSDVNADSFFRVLEPGLYAALARLKSEIEASPRLTDRIRHKYKTKNTTGYSLNAFLDYDLPVDIFSHLLIGSEGTLAFIAEAVLNTVPDYPEKLTGLLVFPDLYAACSAIELLAAAGAAALELMDRASLRSVEEHAGVPAYIKGLPEAAAGLLVEFQAANVARLQQFQQAASESVAKLALLHPAEFTNDPAEQSRLWKIRKGMFPSVGAVRASGTTAIIEDIAIPVDRLADAAIDLRKLFARHGYNDAIIFGHAKDGNLHFVLSQGFNSPGEIERYRGFMGSVVTLVVGKYDGALKAEHGTGRNMAPFVETEWGQEAYNIMKQLKAVADPHHLLNPGVLLNSDPIAHISHLKQMPEVEPEVDKCIECGYCEHSCPSRDLTLTPRQRIVVRRELQRLHDNHASAEEYDALERDFPYMVLDTCAVDGLCATNCPVGIDTGQLTRRFRALEHTNFANQLAAYCAQHFVMVEQAARLTLFTGHLVESLLGRTLMRSFTKTIHKLTRRTLDEPFWQWIYPMPRPQPLHRALPARPRDGAVAVYFPTCISRIMGAMPGEPSAISSMQALLNIADRAKIGLHLPRNVAGHCCGVPFSSKGFESAHKIAVNRTIESFYSWTNAGQLPIVIDASPCAYGLKTCRPHLSAENREKFDKLQILDSVDFVQASILPSLPIQRTMPSVALHPVCSSIKLGNSTVLTSLAKACSDNVTVPTNSGCCAFAGDRGMLHPELTASATQEEAAELSTQDHDGYYSTSRTCEIGMTRATGKTYRSYLHLLDYASRPDSTVI